jgi:aryl-alcohol dehydrogenase-like predicted oxidoreductase
MKVARLPNGFGGNLTHKVRPTLGRRRLISPLAGDERRIHLPFDAIVTPCYRLGLADLQVLRIFDPQGGKPIMNEPSRQDVSRRDFLKTASAGAALALTAEATLAEEKRVLPQKVLGRTKVKVPVLGLGTAPAGFRPEKEAVAFYNECIDRGVTYIDTAPEFAGYGKAQVYLGHVLKERRKEVLLVTKCFEPNGEKALQLLKKNLSELQVEQADLVYAHSIGDDKMTPEKIYATDGVCKALEKARRDGLTRFVGVSGHNRPDRFLRALEEWDYDVQMNAVSLVARHIYNFEGKVWPKAAKKGVGLAAMKVFGGATKEGKGARLPADMKQSALRYALGITDVSVVVVGIHDAEELQQNLEWLKAYKPLTGEERKALDQPTRDLAKSWGNLYGPVV